MSDAVTRVVGLVEDSDDDFQIFERAFAPVATVRRWESGEALAQEFERSPELLASLDLLVVDLNLPGIDGVQLVRLVRASVGGDLPVLMLTGSGAERDVVRALDADVTEYEVKPSNLTDLRALVERSELLLR